ncbi:MAG: peptidoglycan DD-metalloendopeptidase family protein [Syntrophobacterales bacterium]|nr:peptidoglycan DD-metalloendopeptidase family protein [Syntrophobacterales bacterium]
MDRLRKKSVSKRRAVFAGCLLIFLATLLTAPSRSFSLEQSLVPIDEMAKIVNESERRKIEIARTLRENKRVYDLLEEELVREKRLASENLIRLHRIMVFNRFLSNQKILGGKVWWNAELVLRAHIEESLRRQAACKMQMEELRRLEKVLEKNLRELTEAEGTFKKNLQHLASLSREVLKRQALEDEDRREDRSFGSFFQRDETTHNRSKLTKTSFASLGSLLFPVEDGVLETSVELKKKADSVPLVYSKGVFIRAKDGTPVRAVASGQVVYSGWFREFGRTVIVDHGNHYFSVIAYLGSIRVSEGDDVKQGDVIGEVAQSEVLGESGIYFEWRHKGKPLDVRQWFALKTNTKKGD